MADFRVSVGVGVADQTVWINFFTNLNGVVHGNKWVTFFVSVLILIQVWGHIFLKEQGTLALAGLVNLV